MLLDLQFRPRFPGADIERPKFLAYLKQQAADGNLEASRLYQDVADIGGKNVGQMHQMLQSEALDTRSLAWKWTGTGAAVSGAGSLAGYVFGGGLLWGAAGLVSGAVAAYPVYTSLREGARLLEVDERLVRLARAADRPQVG